MDYFLGLSFTIKIFKLSKTAEHYLFNCYRPILNLTLARSSTLIRTCALTHTYIHSQTYICKLIISRTLKCVLSTHGAIMVKYDWSIMTIIL